VLWPTPYDSNVSDVQLKVMVEMGVDGTAEGCKNVAVPGFTAAIQEYSHKEASQSQHDGYNQSHLHLSMPGMMGGSQGVSSE
jgi:hypothetical protein